MTEYETYDLALNAIRFGHELAEAALAQIQFWAGVSYALLAITFLAPQRLTVAVTAILLALYIAFSVSTMSNAGFDVDAANAARHDAKRILEEKDLTLDVVEEKLRAEQDYEITITRGISSIYIPGLFLGTLGYVLYASRKEYISRRIADVR